MDAWIFHSISSVIRARSIFLPHGYKLEGSCGSATVLHYAGASTGRGRRRETTFPGRQENGQSEQKS
jgi:hypothetical protein